MYPLAVIGSIDLVKVGNKLIRGRSYEWGTVSVENESHCDFLKFREMLLSTNMLDLIEKTHTKNYQLYRSKRLREIGFKDDYDEDHLNQSENRSINEFSESSSRRSSIQEVYSTKKAQLVEEIERRETEIKENFIRKVKDKEVEIRQVEKDLNERYNKWKREQLDWTDRLEQDRKNLEDEMREFAERKYTFDRAKLATLSSNGKSGKKK